MKALGRGALPATGRVAVLGLGRTGRAVVAALVRDGADVFVSEARSLKPRERGFLEQRRVPWEEGGHTDAVLDASLIVPSPGIPADRGVIASARARGIRVWSELELAYRSCRPERLIAVTGTNGKTSTTALIGAMLRAGGKRPVVAGNIGRPAMRSVGHAEGSPWVLEVSSYQLELVDTFRPDVAVWMNFAPDHLARHGTLARYFAAKARLLARQKAVDAAVLPSTLGARLVPRARWVDPERQPLPIALGEVLPPHQRTNVRAGWSAVVAAYPELQRCPPAPEIVLRALHQPHRLQTVGTWRGVRFVDDSKATNADATMAALRSIVGPIVLILGGRHKEEGYGVLRAMLEERVRCCVLIGEARPMLEALLASWSVPYVVAEDPLEALTAAYRASSPGDVVLLSPGCSSFDMFKDYAHRGRVFQRAFASLRRTGC